MKILERFLRIKNLYKKEREQFIISIKTIVEKEGSYKISKFMGKDGSYVRKALAQKCSDDVLIKIVNAIIKMRRNNANI